MPSLKELMRGGPDKNTADVAKVKQMMAERGASIGDFNNYKRMMHGLREDPGDNTARDQTANAMIEAQMFNDLRAGKFEKNNVPTNQQNVEGGSNITNNSDGRTSFDVYMDMLMGINPSSVSDVQSRLEGSKSNGQVSAEKATTKEGAEGSTQTTNASGNKQEKDVVRSEGSDKKAQGTDKESTAKQNIVDQKINEEVDGNINKKVDSKDDDSTVTLGKGKIEAKPTIEHFMYPRNEGGVPTPKEKPQDAPTRMGLLESIIGQKVSPTEIVNNFVDRMTHGKEYHQYPDFFFKEIAQPIQQNMDTIKPVEQYPERVVNHQALEALLHRISPVGTDPTLEQGIPGSLEDYYRRQMMMYDQ